MKIKAYDNGGKTFDRYVIIIKKDVYFMSINANSPQGYNQYDGLFDKDIKKYISSIKEIRIEDLPSSVLIAIIKRIEQY